jgi:hypothetical protein
LIRTNIPELSVDSMETVNNGGDYPKGADIDL